MSSMINSFGNDIKDELIKLELIDKVVGCTEDELKTLMSEQSLTYIPDLYHQLMLVMGHSGIEILFDGDCTFKTVKRLKNTIKQNRFAAPHIPDDALVFISDQSGFFFLPTNNHEDDPPVYLQTQGQAKKIADHLSIFVSERMEAYKKMIAESDKGFFYDPESGQFYTNSE